MAFVSEYFTLGGKRSDEFGIYNVRLEGGMVGSPYASAKNIIEDKIPYRDTPMLTRIELEPIQFTMTFTLIDSEWNDTKRYEIGQWLFKKEYQEFKTSDNMGKLLYVMAINPTDFYSVDLKNGYFSVEFRASTSYWLSEITINTFDLSHIGAIPTTIEINSLCNVLDENGDDYYYPELWIDLYNGNTNITLKNLSDGGRETTFTSLSADDSIYMNNKLKQLESGTGNYILSKFNKNWLRLRYGLNRIQVSNACILQFKSQFPLLI